MLQKPRGRLYQSNNFIFEEFNSLKIEKTFICENPETKSVIIVYVKVENNGWHQFFLDAGYGFWEDWEEIDLSDENYNYIDITATFHLNESPIKQVVCQPNGNNSEIFIEFETRNKFILRTILPDFDSDSEVVFEYATNLKEKSKKNM